MRLSLQQIRKRTAPPMTEEQMSAWLSDHRIVQDVNLITQTVEFHDKGSADPGSRPVREMMKLLPENAGEALGKLWGFGRRDVGAISPQIESDV